MSTLEAVTMANNLFTVDLAKQMNGDQNVVLSPLSTIIALLLICLGAEETTEAQMKQVLHIKNCRDIHYGIQDLMFVLQNATEYKLDIENKLFVEETCKISDAYVNSSAWYNSKPEKVAFRNATGDAMEHINSWLKEKSEGTFQNMSETLISNNTKIVAVNTAYLLANWTQNFPKQKTKYYEFTLSNNEKVSIEMMSAQGKFNLRTIDDEKLRILELPYGLTKDLCMYIILPDNSNDLYKVVENLSFEKLTSWTDPKYMKKKYTTVFLPHFQIESAYSMKEMMSSMGMLDVFNETKATFTGISKDNLFILDIISLATVNADEDGTKDITNTDDYFGFLALMLPEATFRVDHPFFYVIQHKPTNCYVFYGTFQKP
ncbi:ovalbumin-related protein X-like [Rana temporaria]|uniref:ovalbumin-related protein X-like n=1 Tax=Rana temporaria TaxID=8407 RepID=UPI001AAD027E|nr:ovalbumin-related protein X-like [Rana temporaria]XP_040209553.1 ovalbumin-related protein X-like [Rana temporaria]XP_040209555.1 ovalbumin-related protein X-like [Rana temporaria]